MNAASPQEVVKLLDEAFNRGDVNAILEFYEDHAVMVVEPGRLARGKEELRNTFENIVRSKVSTKQEKTHVLEAEGVALFTSRWSLSATVPDGSKISRTFIATSVFRKNSEGGWRLVIDNSFGGRHGEQHSE
jgi:uncharacterized protein (TIGR02246 family)